MLIAPDRWKLVASEFDEHELYDLSNDPWELCNLAHDRAQAGRRADLDVRLGAWQVAVGDECPLNE